MMVGRVFVFSGPHTGKKVFVLDRLNVYEVGKASGSHIKLHDDSMAMNQCRFYKKGEEYTVYALSEHSPTLVNGAQVKKYVLKSGDVVRIGATELLFELVAPEHADVPPALAAAPAQAAPQGAQAPAADRAPLPKNAAEPAAGAVPAAAGPEGGRDAAGAPSAAPAFARLLVLDGEKRGQEFSLMGKDQFKVGRATGSDVRLPDAKISRNHCLIESTKGCYVIIDLESANGTIVNGEKVKKSTLKNGDFLRLGFTMLKFELADK